MTSGIKHDIEKPRMDLLDAHFLEGVARVLTFGAKKYDAHNWRKGLTYSRVIAAALRHIGEIQKGIDIDPETGELHADHAGCCLQFLSHYMHTNRTELDDRYTTQIARPNQSEGLTDKLPQVTAPAQAQPKKELKNARRAIDSLYSYLESQHRDGIIPHLPQPSCTCKFCGAWRDDFADRGTSDRGLSLD